MQGEIVAIGAANVDVMGRSRNPLVPEDSNPGRISVSVGGVARNICENAARLGLPARMIAMVGGDDYGRRILRRCRESGIRTDSVFVLPQETSSSYLSIHRPNGEMSVAVSDMHILQKLTPEMVDKQGDYLRKAAAVVVDGCLPEETLAHIIETYGGETPIFADTVSTAYARRFLGCLKGIHTLKPNRLEAEVLSGISIRSEADYFRAGDAIVRKGVERVVISAGARGCFYTDCLGQACWARTRPARHIRSATGAGDSFMAGLIYSFYHGLCLPETLDFSMGAALAALQAPGAINSKLSADMVRRVMKEYQS